MTSLNLQPITLAEARRFVVDHHRHSGPPRGWRFGVGLALDSELVGVAIAGQPVARNLDDGWTIEVVRVCLSPSAPKTSASRLYGAIARAAQALGYRRLVTYTLADEAGVSPRAAGFRAAANRQRRDTWHRPSRPRYASTLFGEPIRPDDPKQRWDRDLTATNGQTPIDAETD